MKKMNRVLGTLGLALGILILLAGIYTVFENSVVFNLTGMTTGVILLALGLYLSKGGLKIFRGTNPEKNTHEKTPN